MKSENGTDFIRFYPIRVNRIASLHFISHLFTFPGLAYKHKVGGSHHQLKDEFPGLEEQIQLSDILGNEKMHQFFRQHFRAFLHYLEDSNPALSYHTEYMQKMHKHILKVMKVLDKCGYERLISICHGDAKPNNFLFRNICIGKKHVP